MGMMSFYVGKGVARPFLPVNTHMDGTVSGLLFLDPQADDNSEWVSQNCFYSPAATEKYEYWVAHVRFGRGVGEYSDDPLPEPKVPGRVERILRPIKEARK